MDGSPEEEERVHARAREGGRAQAEYHRGGDRRTEADDCVWGTVAPNNKGTESSVPVVSVWGLEHHHPTMSTLWGHVDRSKKKEIKYILIGFVFH